MINVGDFVIITNCYHTSEIGKIAVVDEVDTCALVTPGVYPYRVKLAAYTFWCRAVPVTSLMKELL